MFCYCFLFTFETGFPCVVEADLDLVSVSSCLNVFGFVCLFVLYLQDFELRNRQAILELDRTLNII